MDISLNTLDFLVSQVNLNKIYKKTNIEDNLNFKRDLLFYRKRIFQMTKDLLRFKKINNEVELAFQDFVNICINHLKIIDTNDIIQSEYEYMTDDVKNEPLFTNDNITLEAIDELIMNKPEVKENKIEDSLNITVKRENKKEVRIIPKQKNINLKDKTLREKGIKKKKKNKNK